MLFIALFVLWMNNALSELIRSGEFMELYTKSFIVELPGAEIQLKGAFKFCKPYYCPNCYRVLYWRFGELSSCLGTKHPLSYQDCTSQNVSSTVKVPNRKGIFNITAHSFLHFTCGTIPPNAIGVVVGKIQVGKDNPLFWIEGKNTFSAFQGGTISVKGCYKYCQNIYCPTCIRVVYYSANGDTSACAAIVGQPGSLDCQAHCVTKRVKVPNTIGNYTIRMYELLDYNCKANNIQYGIVIGTVAVKDVNECTSGGPCKNGGKCSNTIGSYNCTCPKQFTGKDCETDVDECIRKLCKNGGTCTNSFGGFNCTCLSGWSGNKCEQVSVPSAPRDVVALFVNESAVRITWTPPLKTGSSHVFYDVRCLKPCESSDNCRDTSCGGDISYVPKMEGLNATQVAVTNLLPFEKYTFKIYSIEENGLQGNFSTLTIKTLESAPGKPEVFLELLEGNTIRISWKLNRKNGVILAYNLTYTRMDNPQDTQTIKTTNTTLVLSGLKPGKIYSFVVTAENRAGRTSSKMETFLTSDGASYRLTNSSGQNSRQTTYIVISVILGVILLIVLIVIGICYRRRKTQFKPQERLGNRQHLEVNVPLDGEEIQMDYLFPETITEDTEGDRKRQNRPVAKSESLQDLQVNVPPEAEEIQKQHLPPETNMEDTEVDGQYLDLPQTHVDQYQDMSQTRSFELEREDIIFERLLGSGNFGEVHKAVIGNNAVAVKSLKGRATPKDKSDMITELNVMKSLKPHPHVLKLIGCCSLSDPLLIVLEYLPYGDLLGYLRKSRGHSDVYNSGEKTPTSSLSATDLLSFAWMIADGMEYLAKMKIVHRDLAARNILVGENNVCKISDFGLARDINADIYVQTSQARLPVKWMPPESLFHSECSTMSDVWSYGIVLWEVFTIGDSPYPGVKAMKVAALLANGYRMPRPIHISEELYAIMSECWSEKPEERPSFQWICAAVKRLIDDEKTYLNLDDYNDEDYVNFDMFDGLQ